MRKEKNDISKEKEKGILCSFNLYMCHSINKEFPKQIQCHQEKQRSGIEGIHRHC